MDALSCVVYRVHSWKLILVASSQPKLIWSGWGDRGDVSPHPISEQFSSFGAKNMENTDVNYERPYFF
jgi:hypothetical protein